jgi:ribonuclease HI
MTEVEIRTDSRYVIDSISTEESNKIFDYSFVENISTGVKWKTVYFRL